MEEAKELIQRLAKEISEVPQIKPESVPEIDLYMDQLLSFLDKRLPKMGTNPDSPFMTKTMVNNYVKAKLLPPVVKKKYRCRQVLSLAMIGQLKKLFSMQELEKFYAAALPDQEWEQLYQSFLNAQKEAFAELPKLSEQLSRIEEPMEREQELAQMAVQLAAQSQARMMLAARLLEQMPSLKEKQSRQSKKSPKDIGETP